MTSTAFRLTDSTLRDGSHALSHRYTTEQVASIVRGLDAAGVPVIEVNGDGLGGSSFNYGFSGTDERELVSAAVAAATQAGSPAAARDRGRGRPARHGRAGVRVARIATHCTEADIASQHIRLAKRLGMEAVGFLMMAHMASAAELLAQARLMESYGADCVYVVDSAGAMTTADARARVGTLAEGLGCQVGHHAHNNLSLAVANSLAALEAGAAQLDGCCAGLGRGRELPDRGPGRGLRQARPDHRGRPAGGHGGGRGPGPAAAPGDGGDRPGRLLLGYAGVYGSFLLHAQRAAGATGSTSARSSSSWAGGASSAARRT